ncbi:MAG: hypothetical protein AAFW89_00995 [Bacteroidota bacterium]
MASTSRWLLSLSAVCVFTAFISCSSTQPAADSAQTERSVPALYPGWYLSSGFESDSLQFFGTGTSISGDSLTAAQSAEQQARINLGKALGNQLEEARATFTESGNADGNQKDFILILREAGTLTETAAELDVVEVRSIRNGFRAFSRVTLTKAEARKALERGFTGHPRYWSGFSGSDGFKAIIGE